MTPPYQPGRIPINGNNPDPAGVQKVMKMNPEVVWRRVDPDGLELANLQAATIGGTGGIGRAVARFLASRGAKVSVVGRTFRDPGVSGLEFMPADLELMREADRVGRELPAETLDLVIFTTGIFAAPKRQETPEGLERDMAVSYLSRLAILRGIAPRLGTNRTQSTLKPRVFVMGFPGAGQAGHPDDLNAEKSYGAMPVHMNTVAGNEMLVLDGARRYPHVNFFGLNPGLIRTNIRDNFLGAGSWKSRIAEGLIGLLAPGADDYAKTIAPLLISPDLEGHTGAMFDRKGRAVLPTPKLADESYVNAFIAASESLIARTGVRIGS